MKALIDDAFSLVPEGKRGALLVIADEQGARAHLAAKLNDRWKVAAGLGVPWQGEKPSGWVAVQASW
jgi:hypothetical protein